MKVSDLKSILPLSDYLDYTQRERGRERKGKEREGEIPLHSWRHIYSQFPSYMGSPIKPGKSTEICYIHIYRVSTLLPHYISVHISPSALSLSLSVCTLSSFQLQHVPLYYYYYSTNLLHFNGNYWVNSSPLLFFIWCVSKEKKKRKESASIIPTLCEYIQGRMVKRLKILPRVCVCLCVCVGVCVCSSHHTIASLSACPSSMILRCKNSIQFIVHNPPIDNHKSFLANTHTHT